MRGGMKWVYESFNSQYTHLHVEKAMVYLNKLTAEQARGAKVTVTDAQTFIIHESPKPEGYNEED